MDRKQVIDELKALLQGFEDEYKAVPICLIEAIKLLENDGKYSEQEK